MMMMTMMMMMMKYKQVMLKLKLAATLWEKPFAEAFGKKDLQCCQKSVPPKK